MSKKNYLLHTEFENQIKINPSKIAIIFKDNSYTYEQINSYSNYYASKLINMGLKKGDIVGIYGGLSLFTVIGVLAVLKAGGAYLPINPNHPQERNFQMLKDSNASYILCEESCECFLDFNVISLKNLRCKKDNLDIDIIDNQLAYIIYTSGSTGTPKGVMVEHKSITNHLIDFNKRLKFSSTDTFLGLYNFNVDATVESIFGILNVGGTLLICDEEIKNDVFKIYSLIKKYGVTLFAAPPVILKIINKSFDVKETKLKTILTGGDELVSDYIDNLYKNVKLMNGYGITEACVSTLWHRVIDISKKIPIGKPLENSLVYLLDENLSEVSDGEIGEIVIGGNSLAKGYVNDIEKTAEKFIFFNGKRVYKTGDLGKKLPDGSIEFCGRKDFQINLRGFRIEPTEIEVAIRKIPNIDDVYVTINQNDVLIAYIVRDSEGLTPNVIKKHLEKHLPSYMIPAVYEFVPTIPRNDMGKVKNLILKNKRINITEIDNLNSIQKLVRKIWSQILKVSESVIDKDSNFIELGGNSLLIMELTACLNKEFNKKILVKDILKFMTVEDQAQLIENHEDQVIIEKTSSNKYPLSSAQKRILFMQNLKNNGMYNTVSVQLLVGKLNISKLISCFRKIFNDNRIFNCVFKYDVIPYSKVIETKNSILIDYIDKRNDNWYDQKKYIDNVIYSELTYCFTLDQLPLARFKLVHLSDNQTMLIGNIHHILIDGISWNIIFNNIKSQYNNDRFDVSDIDYLDFCVWESQNQSNNNCKESVYWKNELSNLDNSICLEDPDVPSPCLNYEGDYIDLQINSNLVDIINKTAKILKVTEFSILLACLEILISFYQHSDIGIVGIPTNVKVSSELQNVPGLFINMLPIKYEFKEFFTLKNIFEKFNAKLLNHYKNGSYPFERIVRDSGIKYFANRSPIFQVMLDYIDFGKEIPIKDCTIINVDIPSIYSKYELSLIVSKNKNAYSIRFEYCTGVFTKNFIKQFSNNYFKILNSIENYKETKISDLKPIVTIPQKKLRQAPSISKSINKINDSKKQELLCKFKLIWEKLLKTQEVNLDKNLFDIGITSLNLISAITKMEDIFKVHLEVMELFNCSNLKAIFDYVINKINTNLSSPQNIIVPSLNTKNKILNIANKTRNLKNKKPNNIESLCVKLEKLSDGTENKNIIFIPPLLGVSEEYHKQRFADICSNLDKKYNVYSCMYKSKDDKIFSVSELSKVISKEINENLKGTNFILSWCNGGYVAFEVSKLLTRIPKKLILVDTYEPNYLSEIYKDINQNLKHELALFTQSFLIDMDNENEYFKDNIILKDLLNLDFNGQLEYIQKNLCDLIDQDSLSKIYTRYYELYKKSMDRANNILKNFKPTTYNGDILIFYINNKKNIDKTLGWRKFCNGNILCNAVNGNHNTMMLSPNVLTITKVINELKE